MCERVWVSNGEDVVVDGRKEIEAEENLQMAKW
jgi:hypothetical protein